MSTRYWATRNDALTLNSATQAILRAPLDRTDGDKRQFQCRIRFRVIDVGVHLLCRELLCDDVSALRRADLTRRSQELLTTLRNGPFVFHVGSDVCLSLIAKLASRLASATSDHPGNRQAHLVAAIAHADIAREHLAILNRPTGSRPAQAEAAAFWYGHGNESQHTRWREHHEVRL